MIAVFAAGLVAGCSESSLSPTSPSLMSSRSSDEAPRARARFAPRPIDEDGDGYEDPEPGPGPAPDPGIPPAVPGEVPPPGGLPPEGAPLPPVPLTINIVGSFGTLAYAPNPLQAAIGNTIVWTNSDFVQHHIVLDNGTMVGNLAPGQSSVPVPLATETVGYRCTIHPSMTGQIVPVPALPTGQPAPGDPSQAPLPDPSAPAPPPADPYGGPDGDSYDDGYDYDYY